MKKPKSLQRFSNGNADILADVIEGRQLSGLMLAAYRISASRTEGSRDLDRIKEHKDERPSVDTDESISYPPFENKITWGAVSQSQILKQAGYKSLRDFCDQKGLGKVKRFTDYTIDDVISAIYSYRGDNNGDSPGKETGLIPYEPFNNNTKWRNIWSSAKIKKAGFSSVKKLIQSLDNNDHESQHNPSSDFSPNEP